MLYVLALFVPPLALLLAGKPVPAVLSLVIYVCSWVALFLAASLGMILWLVAMVHAIIVINARNAEQRVQRIHAAQNRK